MFVMAVGAFNILAGIISTIQQFLKITQLNEAHRVSTIAWDKFYRNIKIELAKHPDERIAVTHMIKMCKEEFDRLMETSPVIPEKIIAMFKHEFSDDNMIDDLSPDGVDLRIKKPEICGKLVSTRLTINQWSTEPHDIDPKQDAINANIEKNKNAIIMTRNNYLSQIEEFKRSFTKDHNRAAMRDEIINNLKDKIDRSIIEELLDENEGDEIV